MTYPCEYDVVRRENKMLFRKLHIANLHVDPLYFVQEELKRNFMSEQSQEISQSMSVFQFICFIVE